MDILTTINGVTVRQDPTVPGQRESISIERERGTLTLNFALDSGKMKETIFSCGEQKLYPSSPGHCTQVGLEQKYIGTSQ